MKNLKWNMILASIGYIILGILLLLMPNTAQSWICFLLGIFAVVMGLFQVIGFLASKSPDKYLSTNLATGVLLVVMGIFLFSNPSYLFEFIRIAMGFIILFDSVLKIQNALSIQKMHYSYWWFFAIISIITAILGVLLVFGKFGNNTVIFFWASVLIADGIVNIIVALALSILTGKFNKAVKKATTQNNAPIEAEVVQETAEQK